MVCIFDEAATVLHKRAAGLVCQLVYAARYTLTAQVVAHTRDSARCALLNLMRQRTSPSFTSV